MKSLFIMAAGKQSRFQAKLPKALTKIAGKSNLINTIEKVQQDFDKIYVVVDHQSAFLFREYLKVAKCDKVKLLTIHSGFGSGHAVLQGLEKATIYDDIEDVSILWGDTYLQDSITIREMINFKSNGLIVPVQQSQNPYVSVSVDRNMNATGVKFSKYGDMVADGYWDRSMFRHPNRDELIKSLETINSVIQCPDSTFITASKEFEFLYIIPYLANIGKPADVFVTQFGDSVMSYNTIEEIEHIKKGIAANDETTSERSMR